MIILLLVAVSLVTLPNFAARAHDSLVELAIGGLAFGQSNDIEMVSEDLGNAVTAGGRMIFAQLDDPTTARSAWAKAVALAKERAAGRICEAEAYQSVILSELTTAVKLSPYLKNEVLKGLSDSAKVLHSALAGNLMLFDLIGMMSTPEQVADAIVGSIWYSQDGGVAGSRSILWIGKTQVREFVIDPETYKRRAVIWAYRFGADTGELTLSNGGKTRHYKLNKVRKNGETVAYELIGSSAEVGYSNEPNDCSA